MVAVLDTKFSFQARWDLLGSPLQGRQGDLMGTAAHEEPL